MLPDCSAPAAGDLPGPWLSAAQPQVTPQGQEMARSRSAPPAEKLLCLSDLQPFTSLYVLQQLHNTTRYQVFHTPHQDLVTAQNSTRVL